MAGSVTVWRPRADGLTLSQVAFVLLATGMTAAMIAFPRLHVALPIGDARAWLEVLGAAIIGFAATVLAIPENADVRPARNAFLAGLLVLAVSNAVAALYAVIAADPTNVGFWPWISARGVAGSLFLLGASERTPRSLARRASVGVAAWAVVTTVTSVTLGNPRGSWAIDGSASPSEALALGPALLVAGPALLFAVAAWSAARLYRRSAAGEYAWLSLALSVQVVAQIHEIAFPSFLGPWLTSADLLRFTSFLLLVGAATTQLRRLYRERSLVVVQQDEDLRAREMLVARLRDFAEEEAAFRTIVAHELATPLATINAFAHVVTSRAAGHDDVHVRRAVEGIRAETSRLRALSERMDELRDLESSAFRCDLRAVSVGPMIDDALNYLRALGTDRHLDVEVEPARVMLDPVRFGQAVRNVLTNAVKHTASGSAIVVRGRSLGERYELRIEDDGPGIAVGERRHVLRRYTRGEEAAEDGHGVGLYLVERIMTAHGGGVRIEDGAPGTVVVLTVAVAS